MSLKIGENIDRVSIPMRSLLISITDMSHLLHVELYCNCKVEQGTNTGTTDYGSLHLHYMEGNKIHLHVANHLALNFYNISQTIAKLF